MLACGHCRAGRRKALSGAVRAAANLLTGLPPMRPSQEVNAAAAKLSRASPRTPDEEDRLQAALTASRALPTNQRTRLSPTQAVRQAGARTATAGAGPSGWRSSYIQLTASTPNGPASLGLWAYAWASGEVDIQTPPAGRLRWPAPSIKRMGRIFDQSSAPKRCSNSSSPLV